MASKWVSIFFVLILTASFGANVHAVVQDCAENTGNFFSSPYTIEHFERANYVLNRALASGLAVKGFCDGMRQPVVRIENFDDGADAPPQSWSAHPNLSVALIQAAENLETASKKSIGTSLNIGSGRGSWFLKSLNLRVVKILDDWLKRGWTFSVAEILGQYVLTLEGIGSIESPQEVEAKIMKEWRRTHWDGPVYWSRRGRRYVSVPIVHQNPRWGGPHLGIRSYRAKGDVRIGEQRDTVNARKTGRGASIAEALDDAIRAEPEEIPTR